MTTALINFKDFNILLKRLLILLKGRTLKTKEELLILKIK